VDCNVNGLVEEYLAGSAWDYPGGRADFMRILMEWLDEIRQYPRRYPKPGLRAIFTRSAEPSIGRLGAHVLPRRLADQLMGQVLLLGLGAGQKEYLTPSILPLIPCPYSWEAVAPRSKCILMKATARRVDSAVSGMGRGRPT
jgi:hypothetical protein